MKHCESCNIVHVNLECPLCAANMKIEGLKMVIAQIKDKILEGVDMALPFIVVKGGGK